MNELQNDGIYGSKSIFKKGHLSHQPTISWTVIPKLNVIAIFRKK